MKQVKEQVNQIEAPTVSQVVPINQNKESSAVLAAITGMMDRGINADAAERWMGLWNQVEAKEAQRQFHEALAKVQSQVPSIEKNGEIRDKNRNVVSGFSTYEDIMRAVKPLLDQYGMTFTCVTGKGENGLVPVTGILGHIGGHTMESVLELPAETSGFKNVVQGVGSSLSYSRRYLAILMLNIVSADIDDDGVAAGQTAAPPPAGPTISKANLAKLRKMLTQLGETAEAALCEKLNIDTLDALAEDRVIGAFKYIESKVASAKPRKSK